MNKKKAKKTPVQDDFDKFFKDILVKSIEFIFSAIFTIVFFIIINTAWENIPFLTDDIKKCLPFINLSLIIGILSSFILIFVQGKFYKNLLHIPQDIFSLVANTILLVVFPFDFNMIEIPALTTFVKLILIFISIALTIGILARIIKTFISMFD